MCDDPVGLFKTKIVTDDNGCWLWHGHRDDQGYGRWSHARSVHGLSIYVHRAAYTLIVGSVPDGLELDHLCRVPHCANPEHLEPVTHRENMHRGVWPWGTGVEGGIGIKPRKPTPDTPPEGRCKRGHEWSENARRTSQGRWICLNCQRISNRKHDLKRRGPGKTGRRLARVLADEQDAGR